MNHNRYFFQCYFKNGKTLPVEAHDKESASIMALTVTGKAPSKVVRIGEVYHK